MTTDPKDAARNWTDIAEYLAGVRADLDDLLPVAPEGMQGLPESAEESIRAAFEDASAAADLAAGTYYRLAAAVAKQRRETHAQQRPRPVPRSHPEPVNAGR